MGSVVLPGRTAAEGVDESAVLPTSFVRTAADGSLLGSTRKLVRTAAEGSWSSAVVAAGIVVVVIASGAMFWAATAGKGFWSYDLCEALVRTSPVLPFCTWWCAMVPSALGGAKVVMEGPPRLKGPPQIQ